MAIRKDTSQRITSVQFSPRDEAAISALIELEETTRSEIVRRAVREYAERRGVLRPKQPTAVD